MRKAFSLLLAILSVLVLGAAAQEVTGTVTGFVKDSSGAVVPNVPVTVRNTGTGQERKVTSGPEGEYTVPQLAVGNYEVIVEAPGFKKFVAQNIELRVNDRRRVDVTLTVGMAAETVTVEAEANAIQTEDSTVGGVVTGTAVRELPLNGRSLYQLVALQPGVSASSAISSGRVGVGLDNLASVNVNGTRAAQNNWLIDGADNVDTGSNLATINYISVDAVSEFRILRGNYNAEFGRSGGGQINVVTRGGTNEFHGGAYEFWRNDAMDAVKPLLNLDRNGDGKFDPALLRYHNFGYNIGGPIVKDRLHFFFGQEFRRVKTERGTGTTQTRVPTALQRQGDFSEFPTVIIRDPLTGTPFPGNRIPANRLDPNAVALLGLFPMPNATGLAGQRNFIAATPSGRNYREEVIRIDYSINDKHKVFGRYINDDIPSTEPFGEVFGTANSALPGIANTATVITGRNIVGEWNWLAANNKINNFAFNYSRGSIISSITGNASRNISGFNSPERFPENPGSVLPGIAFSSGNYGGFNFFGPYDNNYGSWRIKDTFSWVRGKHSWKFGYLYSHEYKNENAASGVNGAFVFPGSTNASFTSAGDAFADFLMGRASSYSEKDIDITSHLRYDMHEAFAQDDWKILPNLTFNLGVRWSLIQPPLDENNVLSNFDPKLYSAARAYTIAANNTRVPGTGDPLNGIYIAGVNSPFGRNIVETHYNTFGPRVGFAWDPWANGKTAIRGGYGIYFDRTLSGIALQNAFVNPPFVITANFLAAGAAGHPTFANPTGGTQPNPEAALPSLISMSPDFKVPTTQHWSLGFQHELPWQITMDLSYVGNHGTHLLRAIPLNQTRPGTVAPTAASAPYRGYGAITERQTTAGSRYDSLQLSINKSTRAGFNIGSAYTWSKTVTDSPDDRTTTPQDNQNLRAERAVANFSKAHIFVVNSTYELPFFRGARPLLYNLFGGFQIGGIFRAESGTWLTASTTNTSNSAFGGQFRPNIVGNTDGPKRVDRWFNTAAFDFPAVNTFGNSPRANILGPGIVLLDLAVYKNFKVHERVKMQFRSEFFNALNHTNYSGVNTAMTRSSAPDPLTGRFFNTNALFGRVTSALDPRQIQLGLKVNF